MDKMDKQAFDEKMVSIRAKHDEITKLDDMTDVLAGLGKDMVSCLLPGTDPKAAKLHILESSNPNFVTSIQTIYRNEVNRQRNALRKEIADLMKGALEYLPEEAMKVPAKLRIIDADAGEDKE